MGRSEITPTIIANTLYVTDLDGTLLNGNSQLSEESAFLLNQAISLGANITVATARTPATVSILLKDVDLKLPAIVMTGAALWDKHYHKYENVQFIEPKTVGKLKKIYCNENLPVFIYTLKENIIEILHIGELSEIEKNFIEERAQSQFKRFNSFCSESDVSDTLDNVMLFYAMQPSNDVRRTYNRIKNISEINPVFYHDIFGPETGILEVFSRTTSKARAIKYLSNKFGFKRIIVFGDNINDLPMMQIATHSIAVGNAIDEVKNAADEVIGTNSENAVANWILDDIKSLTRNNQLFSNVE